MLNDLHYEAADEPLGPGVGSWVFAAPSGVVPGPVASGCCCCVDDEDEGPVTETLKRARFVNIPRLEHRVYVVETTSYKARYDLNPMYKDGLEGGRVMPPQGS